MTSKTVRAVFENGVFRPVGEIDLPERCEVEFEPRLAASSEEAAHLDRLYAILSQSYETGDPLAAERHNEHQP